MSGIPTPAPGTCWGCVHRSARLKARKGIVWCAKWHAEPAQRCTDYRSQRAAHRAALRFYAAARPR